MQPAFPIALLTLALVAPASAQWLPTDSLFAAPLVHLADNDDRDDDGRDDDKRRDDKHGDRDDDDDDRDDDDDEDDSPRGKARQG